MYEGFVRVAACSPEIRVADTAFNASGIIGAVRLAEFVIRRQSAVRRL